jgi:hypothetical protein
MIRLASAILVAALSMLAVNAKADTGLDFYNSCSNWFTAGLNHSYCHGNALAWADFYAGRREICLNGVQEQQIFLVVQTYMRNHPEQLQHEASQVVESALDQAFPCN